MKKKSLGLGKGLGALIPDIDFNKDSKGFSLPAPNTSKRLDQNKIAISDIITNPYQPRKHFDQEALNDLKNSILEHGVIQPISVRKIPDGYELISGERRCRASKLAGLKEIPAYVLDNISDTQMLEIALIENVQREDLNPIEVAYGYQRLIEECKLTQEEVAIKVGKKRSSVTNFLRLLKLPEQILDSLSNNELSMTSARTILGLNTSEQMIFAWKQVMEQGLSVRAIEKLVKDILSAKSSSSSSDGKDNDNSDENDKKAIVNQEQRAIFNDIEDKLRQFYGTEVKIKTKSKESGSIIFDYYSGEEFERIMEMLNNG